VTRAGSPAFERECLQIAVRTALAAAAAAAAAGTGVRQEIGRDIKIDADFATDARIHDELARQSSLPVLSEERALNAAGETGYRWIVDPIDGSMNFTRGIPFCCVSIALWEGMRPVAGVVHDLTRPETFSGLVGEGAWLNDQPIHVSAIGDRARAVLCSGLPTASAYGEAKLQAFIRRADTFKKLRALGSAALMLAYVAAGRAEAYAEDGIAIWDVAAGLALVAAAGGRYAMRHVGPGERYDVQASNGRLAGIAEDTWD
jgi:myo-inositol-1(or 4)-monophosphatase